MSKMIHYTSLKTIFYHKKNRKLNINNIHVLHPILSKVDNFYFV